MSEEKKETQVGNNALFDKVRANPWILSTVVLGVVLVLVIFLRSSSGVTGHAIGADQASSKLLDFVNAQLNGQGNASIASTDVDGSLYKVTVNYNGQQIPVYVTTDGKYLISQPIPLDGSSATGTTGTTSTSTTTPAASLKISDLNLSNYVSIGNKSAKVTVVEFSDFSCPFCAAASGDNPDYVSYMQQRDSTWEPIVTNLMKDYVDKGLVRFVYIYSMGHTGGHPASLVAWCLDDQNPNFFEQFYPLAFANQADVEDQSKMIKLGETIKGVDSTKLEACVNSGKYNSRFAAEQSIADQVGASGTPAFFVNDVYAAKGAESYTSFKQAVDAALAQ